MEIPRQLSNNQKSKVKIYTSLSRELTTGVGISHRHASRSESSELKMKVESRVSVSESQVLKFGHHSHRFRSPSLSDHEFEKRGK